MGRVEIQIMQVSPDSRTPIGNWMTIEIVEPQPQGIAMAMASIQSRYPPGTRVRAIDMESGRLVDMLS